MGKTYCRSYGMNCKSCTLVCIDVRGKKSDEYEVIKYFKEHCNDANYVYYNHLYEYMDMDKFMAIWGSINE